MKIFLGLVSMVSYIAAAVYALSSQWNFVVALLLVAFGAFWIAKD